MDKENENQTVTEVGDGEYEVYEENPDNEISTEDAEGGGEDSDPFEEFYDNGTENNEESDNKDDDEISDEYEVYNEKDSNEEESSGDDDDSYDDDDTAEDSDIQNNAVAESGISSELEEAARDLLKSIGIEKVDDPVAELKKLTAETLGLSPEEYDSRIAEEKAEVAAWNAQMQKDIDAIHEAYPETRKYKTLKDLPNVRKFAGLMDDQNLNLTAVEAFAASHPDIANAHRKYAGKNPNLNGTKSHIQSSVPKGAKDTSVNISKSEMAALRETFGDELSDKEIKALYRKINK